MGYRIVYGKVSEIERQRRSSGNVQLMTAIFMMLGIMLVRSFWPEGTKMLRQLLLPGTMSATEEAFSQLMADLRIGAPIGEAVTTFCAYVIEHGH